MTRTTVAYATNLKYVQLPYTAKCKQIQLGGIANLKYAQLPCATNLKYVQLGYATKCKQILNKIQQNK